LRKFRHERDPIRLNKTLSPAFHLIVKEPAGFSVLSDLLAPRYPLVAMVRHPLAVLAAWQTIAIPINRGRMPTAERLNPVLKAQLDAEPDCLIRQVTLIGWLLGIYSTFPPEQILRYEYLNAAPAQHLTKFTPQARELDRRLAAVDPTSRYSGVNLAPLARELMSICPVAEKFYPDFEASLAPWL
jgi:hypothetical protein